MITILLTILVNLLIVLVIPLLVLFAYLYPNIHRNDGEIAILRRTIFILIAAKIMFIILILIVDFLALAGVQPFSVTILLILILAVLILGSANWWTLFRVWKLRHYEKQK